MKRGKSLLFFIFVLVFSLNLYFVSSECEEDDIMMKLSGENGALASLWNVSNYPVSLCYSEFFGKEYSGEDPRECNGGNSLVYLQ